MGYTALDFSLIKKKAKNDQKLGERIRTVSYFKKKSYIYKNVNK